MSDNPKPWMKQPGELHDKRGVPIYPGDLLKSYHFTAARYRKKFYLYHIAAMVKGAMRGLHPTEIKEYPWVHKNGLPGFLMSQELASQCEVIAGYGPKKEYLDFNDRPKVKPQTKDQE